MSRVIGLERYVGRPVRDADGRPLGRLHEVRVHEEAGELIVDGYLVGAAGLIERFSIGELGRALGYLFGLDRPKGYVIPWQSLQFPEDGPPRCTVRAAELERG
ncbi:MAG: PRC-barrel domain-containing protein [Burkholderiales bacterium]